MENKNEHLRRLFRYNIDNLTTNKSKEIKEEFIKRVETILENSKEEVLDKIQLAIILMIVEMEYERK